MKTLFSRRDLFAVFASVFLCVFMVGVVTYGATMTISSTGIGSGTSTPGAAIGATGAGIFEGFVHADYFLSTSTSHASGFGTSSPGAEFAVAGGALFEGSVTASFFNATSTTATSTTRFGLTIATTSIVDGYSGRIAIGTTTVPDSDYVATTISTDPGLTISGVGSTANATGTVYIAGGGDTGGMLILKSSDGIGKCLSVSFDSEAANLGAAGSLTTKIVACPGK